jgi:hypothetical protein
MPVTDSERLGGIEARPESIGRDLHFFRVLSVVLMIAAVLIWLGHFIAR